MCSDGDFDEKEKEDTNVDRIDQEDTERHERVFVYSHVLWQCMQRLFPICSVRHAHFMNIMITDMHENYKLTYGKTQLKALAMLCVVYLRDVRSKILKHSASLLLAKLQLMLTAKQFGQPSPLYTHCNTKRDGVVVAIR